MKKLQTKEYEKDCRITGEFNGSSLAIARAVTNNVLPKEEIHCHSIATEYYIFLRGIAEMMVGDSMIAVSSGDVLVIEPGEKHKIIEVKEEIDYIVIRDTVKNDKISM